jgi:hypothetical protein
MVEKPFKPGQACVSLVEHNGSIDLNTNLVYVKGTALSAL